MEVMNRVTRSIAIAAGFCALLLLAAPVTAAGRIVFTERVTVMDSNILLGEAAEISGVSDAGKAELATRSLGAAPRPGNELRLARSQVEARLYNAGINPAEFELSIPETVTFLRKATIVKGSDLLAFAKDYLERSIVWSGGPVRVEFVKEPGDITLSYGTVAFVGILDHSPNQYGASSFRIDVYLDGEKVRTQSMASYLEIFGDTLVAAREIPAGTYLSVEDVETREARLDQLRPGALVSPDDAVGKKARRGIRKGEAGQSPGKRIQGRHDSRAHSRIPQSSRRRDSGFQNRGNHHALKGRPHHEISLTDIRRARAFCAGRSPFHSSAGPDSVPVVRYIRKPLWGFHRPVCG